MDTEESPIWGKLSPLAKGLNTYPLKESKILVGRSEKHCKIIISEKRLSSQHCSIEKEGEKVYLTDLSTNGTYLNT
jgi:pSer/pThr/pTyr-binding forkhead associated (FHA) protein